MSRSSAYLAKLGTVFPNKFAADMTSVEGRLVLKNYRSFGWEHPGVLPIQPGFTVLLGTNNSGKSTLLRSVFELRSLLSAVSTFLINGSRGSGSPLGVTDPHELSNDHDPGRFRVLVELKTAPQAQQPAHAQVSAFEFEYSCREGTWNAVSMQASLPDGTVQRLEASRIGNVRAVGDRQFDIGGVGPVYDCRAISELLLDLVHSRYFPAFRNAINEGAGNHYDLPVGTALVGTWDSWKAGANKAQRLAIGQVERDIQNLLGLSSLQINADATGRTLDVIVDGRPYKLHEVGSGIAQLIIVLAAALVAKPPYILIDEPELNLHPSLQLSFLLTLASYATRGVCLSTHSMGLARSCAAASLHVVRKLDTGFSVVAPFSDKRINVPQLLGELNYSGRAEIGAAGVLLVEGPTEIMCFQELLRKYEKDKDYVVIHLGGSGLVRGGTSAELAEFARLCDSSHIAVVIDSERDCAEAKLHESRESFVTDCTSLGFRVHVLERRAIENYFDDDALHKAFGPSFRALGPYEPFGAAASGWPKRENWRAARALRKEALDQTDLGRFLASLR